MDCLPAASIPFSVTISTTVWKQIVEGSALPLATSIREASFLIFDMSATSFHALRVASMRATGTWAESKQGRGMLISACGNTYVENSMTNERRADGKLN